MPGTDYDIGGDTAAGGGAPWWATYKSGRYYPTCMFHSSAPNTAATVGNVLCVTPMMVGEAVVFNQASLMQVSSVGTGAHQARFGVFADDGGGYPGALIQEFGTVTTNVLGKRDLSITWEPEPGLYWWGTVFQLTGGSVLPQVRRGTSGGLVTMNTLGFDTAYASGYYSLGWLEFTGVSGALPANAPASPNTYRSQTEEAPFVLLRAA